MRVVVYAGTQVIAMVREALATRPDRHGDVDGLVLVGGCGLNVRVNSRLAAAFPNLPVHVPAVRERTKRQLF